MRLRGYGAIPILLAFVVTATGAPLAWGFPVGKKPVQSEAEKKAKEATDAFNRGVERQKAADATWNKGDTTKARRDFQKAADLYAKAIDLKDSFPEAWSNLGYCRRHLGDFQGALVAYQRALTLKPDFPEAIEYRGETFVKMGRIADAQKDYMHLRDMDSTVAKELWEHIEAAMKAVETLPKPPR